MSAILALLTSNPAIIGGIITLAGHFLLNAIVNALPIKAETWVQALGSMLQSIGTALSGSANAVEAAAGSVVTTVANGVEAAEATKQTQVVPGSTVKAPFAG